MPQKPPERQSYTVTVAESDAGARLDRWLAGQLPELSRARLQALIRDGHVQSGEAIRDQKLAVKPGASYTVSVPEAAPAEAVGETIPLTIVFEDRDLIVIDKPAGLVVHPAAGHTSGTLVNALIAHCGSSLSGIGGIMRPGIVHRLDKDTSGLLVVAKNDAAHASLSEQFKSHGRDGRLHRAYLALVWGSPTLAAGTIDVALARSAANRKKISTSSPERGRTAVTHYQVVEQYAGGKRGAPVASLLRVLLETGRTHQIRVHLAHIRHPVMCDDVYGAGFRTRADTLTPRARASLGALSRQALHAAELGFEHPKSAKNMSFTSQLPEDMQALVTALGAGKPVA